MQETNPYQPPRTESAGAAQRALPDVESGQKLVIYAFLSYLVAVPLQRALHPLLAFPVLLVAMGMALVGVLICAGSLNITAIVEAQAGNAGLFEWFWWPLLPLFVIYFISGVAETNRAPFDVAEGESEIVAGFHVEYAGAAFAVFFLAEYANMILVSFLAALLFWGGWLSPFQGLGWGLLSAPGWWWLAAKVFFFAFLFLWFRATFPRYRYDQIMRLGWKVLIPVTLVWLVVVAAWIQTPLWVWK